MPQLKPSIEFFILSTSTLSEVERYACQLIEKNFTEGQTIFVQTNSRAEAERFDTLLWTYHDISFLPHTIHTKANPQLAPIQIGWEDKPQLSYDILVNLSHSIPNFYIDFKRIIELVCADPNAQQLARERYKHYRDQGLELKTHKV